MGALDRLDDRTWDRLCEFLTPDVTQMSSGELDSEIARSGIDIERVYRRVKEAIASADAQRALAGAWVKRESLLAACRASAKGASADIRDRILSAIRTRLPEAQQAVYFRKLEQIATEKDWQSLVDDMERLEIVERETEPGSMPEAPDAQP